MLDLIDRVVCAIVEESCPVQVEAMIDQNTTISQQLSLWDQRGSRVIRGNLLVIPIANSFLYVEPVYLTAETESIPQLKRVIVASGDKVVMQPTLDEALRQVFGEAPATPPPEPRASLPRPAEMDKARGELDEAERALTESNWIAFGQAMQQLEESLAPPRQPQPRGSVASPAQ